MKLATVLVVSWTGPAGAANWYVNSGASGSANGTSWANAWVRPSDVVWGASGVKAGDTLFISGGSVSRVYTNGLTVGASGAAGSPITIRVGQEAGHNGVAVLPAIGIGVRQHIVVDGARNPSFAPPVSVWDIDRITNNIGIKVANPTSSGVFISGAGGENNTVRWVEVGPVGTTNNIGDIHGIQLLNLPVMNNLLIEYCWIHDIQNDGVNLNMVTQNPDDWDALRVRWCIIERTGDDGVQSVRNGFTLSHCFLRDHYQGLYNGHPDQLQLSGISSGYLKVVNNIFRNKANSLIIGEQYVTEGGVLGPMLIAGNVFYNTRDWIYKSIQAYGATFDAWRPNNDISVNQATWNELFVLNNTVYFQSTVPLKIGRANPSGNTRSVWRLVVTNSAVRNNLLVDCGYNAQQPVPISVGGVIDATNGMFYNAASFPLTHNVIAGANTRVSWGGAIYPSGEALTAATGLPGNSSVMPLLSSTNAYDFRLRSSDTVARDRGFNLASLTNRFPELMYDLWGNRRGYSNGWDIGAYEYDAGGPTGGGSGGSDGTNIITSGLLVRLAFDDALTDGQATDSSGGSNHGVRFGHQSAPTNWPVSITYTNPVTGEVGTAARFRWYPGNGWGLYSRSGDYVAITNLDAGGLRTLDRATVLLWVKRNPAPDGDGDGLIEWSEDQGRYISGGYGYSGAWTVGMFTDVGAPYSYVRVYTNNSASADTYVGFGAGTRVVTGGNVVEGSTPWMFLAFTWDRGTLRTYFAGTNVATAILPITNLTVRGPGGSMSTGFLALGCDSHNGNPWLTPNDDTGEQYPNHAWFNGELDDVRIYNRPLSDAEILSIYNGTEDGQGGGGPDPVPPRKVQGVRASSP
ncbi:MAG TPA: LamG domain-containing protein [Methylomirabilota bacterium]|nr:LamG domain-containing protein [Methylomirabilota bacterium]